MRLDEKSIVLTGATGGIGGAIAQALDAAGARLLLTGRDRGRLEQLCGQLRSGRHQLLIADLTTTEGRQALVDNARAFGVQGLINNAGTGQLALLEQMQDTAIEHLVAVNLTTPMLLCKALTPLLREHDESFIVNIGSILGSIGYAGSTAYCASKFGLRGFTEALRRELADTSINVIYFAPRATDTPLNSVHMQALNRDLGSTVDRPEAVAERLLLGLTKSHRKNHFVGWPEAFFVRLNSLLPALVDGALRKKLPLIHRHANAMTKAPNHTPPRKHERVIMKKFLLPLLMWFSLGAMPSYADMPVDSAGSSALARMQTRWAEINYQLKGSKQEAAFEQLLEEAATFAQQHPDDAAILVWNGIIKSSYAGASGGLGALKYAKAAKADLEQAIALDPNVLNGSAYTSLGTLYFKVPGWPVGFGDDKKANELLRKALAINPDGIDPNYFYAEYLRDRRSYTAAEQYYRKALQAPARPGREVADQGRRAEIEAQLKEVQKQIK